MNRIPNQYIIDFRDKMIKENFKKIETKFYDFFQNFKCNIFDKYEGLINNLKTHLGKADLEIEYKDLDYLSHMDAS